MGVVDKMERLVADLLKGLNLPKLPVVARKWIGNNLWWIALVIAILSGINALMVLATLPGSLATIAIFSAFSVFAGWVALSSIISAIFSGATAAVLGMAVKPLQLKQLKGWKLFFTAWLIGVLSALVSVVLGLLSLNIIGAIVTLIFSTIWIAIYVYVLFEVRPEFAHVSKSEGVKGKKTT
jgi:hypothetical protein